MTFLIAIFVIFFVVAEHLLLSAIEAEEPARYQKLGRPDFFTLMWHPIVIVKYWILVITPSPFPMESTLNKRLWLVRVCFMVLAGSIIFVILNE